MAVAVRTAIIHVDHAGDAISGDRILEHLLAVHGIVVEKYLSAHDHTGMVIDDHDHVSPPGFLFTVRYDGWEVGCVSLILISE